MKHSNLRFKTSIFTPIFCTTIFLIVASFSNLHAQKPKPNTNTRIQLEIKPFKNQWVYLGNYYGTTKVLADSTFLDSNSKGILNPDTAYQEGVYILVSPSKYILTEFLITKDQIFSLQYDSIQANTPAIVQGSEENLQFFKYTDFVNVTARKAEGLKTHRDSLPVAEKAKVDTEIMQLNKSIVDYRARFETRNPESYLSFLFSTMHEIKYSENPQVPKSREDTMLLAQYAKEHYWDGIDFTDGRLVRTPIFGGRMEEYLNKWVSPAPDSIIYEMNWMMAYGRNSPEMEKYLIGYFVDHYFYPKIMGQDKVFLEVYEKYIGVEPTKAPWLNQEQIKKIKERAYYIMANQIGGLAWDLNMEDSTGKPSTLYNLPAENYTVIVFWDAHCGRCKEEIPQIDSLYQAWWKDAGINIYGVMTNELAISDWKPYLKAHCLGWINVHQPDSIRDAEAKASKPSFRQLYDMRSTPTLFLLAPERKIIAKNISLDDLNNLLRQKLQKTP